MVGLVLRALLEPHPLGDMVELLSIEDHLLTLLPIRLYLLLAVDGQHPANSKMVEHLALEFVSRDFHKFTSGGGAADRYVLGDELGFRD